MVDVQMSEENLIDGVELDAGATKAFESPTTAIYQNACSAIEGQ
jgi:hypothetical protein